MMPTLRFYRPSLPIAALLLTLTSAHAQQDFVPFHAGSRALFATVPALERTYSLSFDSAAVVAGDSTWYPFRLVSAEQVENMNCPFWGGLHCYPQNVPSFLGTQVVRTGAVLRVYNHAGEELTFDMGAAVGTTTTLYTDATQRFELTREADGTATVLGDPDAFRTWTIAHTDLGGTPIASTLHGAQIRIGETAGLVDFLRADSFPLILEPLTIVGRTAPDLGIVEVDDELIHDHQPGDVIQSHHWRNQPGAGPYMNFNYYLKKIFLSRTELPTQVAYSVRTERFDMGSGVVDVDTVDLYYDRDHVYASLPIEHFTGVSHTLGMEDHCGLGLWHYRTDPQITLNYCVEENCWGPVDTNGPPVQGHEVRVAGLGIYDLEHSILGFSPTGFVATERIVYFEKDGVTCGTEMIVGVGEVTGAAVLRVGPNPTHDRVTLSGDAPIEEIVLYDVNGRQVQRLAPYSTATDVDLSALTPGVFHAVVRFADGRVARSTVVRE